MSRAPWEGRWRRAVVTGGSAGIGAAFAELLAAAGTELVLVARDAGRVEAEAAGLRARHGVRVDARAADLSDRAEVEALATRLGEDGELDLLVNNVGGGELGGFLDRPWSDVGGEITRNLWATARLTHAAAIGMRARGRGDIVNVAAGNAFYPTPFAAAYGAAKAFVVSLTEALAYELRASGVGVTAVCPGFTRTAAVARAGFDERRVPRLLWRSPERVAAIALGAAVRGRPVAHVSGLDRLNAIVGRHAPRSVWVPLVVRGQRRYQRAAPGGAGPGGTAAPDQGGGGTGDEQEGRRASCASH